MLFADDQQSWERWAQVWGPAVPIFMVMVFYVHRLVFITVPRGFRDLRNMLHEDIKANTSVLIRQNRYLKRLDKRLNEVQMCRKHPPRPRPRRRDAK